MFLPKFKPFSPLSTPSPSPPPSPKHHGSRDHIHVHGRGRSSSSLDLLLPLPAAVSPRRSHHRRTRTRTRFFPYALTFRRYSLGSRVLVLFAGVLCLLFYRRLFNNGSEIHDYDHDHRYTSTSTSYPRPWSYLSNASSLPSSPLASTTSPSALNQQELPPLYEKWIRYERSLPQHDWSLSSPPPLFSLGPGSERKKQTKYLFVANHAYGVGWGNVLQEMFLNAYLAFVFDNYTWDKHESDYSEFKGKKIPSRIPVSSMLSGFMIGDPFSQQSHLSQVGDNSDGIPPAISKEYFTKICPNPKIITTGLKRRDLTSGPMVMEDANSANPHNHAHMEDGLTKMNKWIEQINEIDDACLQVGHDGTGMVGGDGDDEEASVFDLWFFFQPSILTLWPALLTSPVITQFGFSELVKEGFEANRGLFYPFHPHNRVYSVAEAQADPVLVRGYVHGPSEPPSQLADPGLSLSSFLPWPISMPKFFRIPDHISISTSLSSVLSPISSFFHKFTTPQAPLKPTSNSSHSPTPNAHNPLNFNPSSLTAPSDADNDTATIPNLLTLHIRRGDFLDFCRDLKTWGVGFQGFNMFEELSFLSDSTYLEGTMDRLDGQDGNDRDMVLDRDDGSAWNWETYRKHCLPSIEEIVDKVARVLKDQEVVKSRTSWTVYIMSNAPKGWLDELKDALTFSSSISSSSPNTNENTKSPNHNQNQNQIQSSMKIKVHTSRDLKLTRDQKYIAQAVDMYIARRSEVFVGNGFSSLSSNIVMLRMADGVKPEKTRLW
ncbi:hypothetical protein D9758_013213 [Tetrapyrgos nigripes]|uniref:Uncharacterized protein n=1 Tax=Tetrapyrgos nigripes TaxID=182062 RepID=A0A8H5FRP5_9AGAR|nr:hypothetical protein D9758_013213 [Tetrapyrgos nigripes]